MGIWSDFLQGFFNSGAEKREKAMIQKAADLCFSAAGVLTCALEMCSHPNQWLKSHGIDMCDSPEFRGYIHGFFEGLIGWGFTQKELNDIEHNANLRTKVMSNSAMLYAPFAGGTEAAFIAYVQKSEELHRANNPYFRAWVECARVDYIRFMNCEINELINFNSLFFKHDLYQLHFRIR